MVFEVYFSDYLKKFNEMKPERWNYHLGCVLMGAEYLYQATGKKRYLDAILNFGKDYVDKDGVIRSILARCGWTDSTWFSPSTWSMRNGLIINPITRTP